MIFRTGDIVRLKSGGPDMTVTHGNELPAHGVMADHSGQQVFVAWFDGPVNRQARFFAAQLDIAHPIRLNPLKAV